MSSSRIYGVPMLIDGALRATSPSFTFQVPVAAGAQPDLGPVTVELDWMSGSYVVFTDILTEDMARIESPSFGRGGLMPGAMPGNYSPDQYYVFERSAASLPPGIISLVVRVKAGGFTYQHSDTLRVVNHKNGERMPSEQRRFVDPVNGNDANNGLSEASPLRTINFAIDSMFSGAVAGADVVGRDLAGAEIVVLGGRVSWTNGNWKTSEPGWLTITGRNGARLAKVDPNQYNPATDSMAFGSSQLPGEARVRFVDLRVAQNTPAARLATGVTARCWLQGCTTKSDYFRSSTTTVPNIQHSVRWADDFGRGGYLNVEAPLSPFILYFTSCRWMGTINGPERYKLALDCTVGPFMGVAYYHNIPLTAVTSSCTAFGARFDAGMVVGYVRVPFNQADPGVGLTASTPSAGVLRIQIPAGYPTSLLNDFVELGPTVTGLHTNPAYGLRVTGFTVTPGINGTRKVLAAGNSGGRDYVDLEEPSLSLGAPETATNGKMFTANLRAPFVGVEIWDLHPDFLYISGPRTRDVVINTAFYDGEGAQVIFNNFPGDRNSCWYRNIRGPMNPDLVNNMNSGEFKNCLLENMIDGGYISFSDAVQHPGTLVLNSVFRGIGNNPLLTQMQWSHVHVVLGPAIGTSGTTGLAWSNDPRSAPFDIEPLPVLVGTGRPGRKEPDPWAFSQVAPSRGSWKNTAVLNWGLPYEDEAPSYTGSRVVNIGQDNPQARIRGFNRSSSTFDGWMPLNTDTLALGADAAGKSGGYFVHHGKATGLNTRMVDILVRMEPNTGFGLSTVTIDNSQTFPVPEVPPEYFGGSPTFDGVAMTLVSTTNDGRGVVRHWRMRHPSEERFLIQMWGRHYPGEPWMRAEILIVHNHIDRPELAVEWPGGVLAYGNGQLTLMGSSLTDGRLVEVDTTFYDGQGRAIPALWAWPNRYRSNPDDSSSVAALRTFLVDGHGITRLYPDGNAFERLGQQNWGTTGVSNTFSKLHDWSVDPDGVVKSSNPTGYQPEWGFNISHPTYRVDALPKAYALACMHAKKPNHYYEVNGDILDIQTKSGATFSANSVRFLGCRPALSGVTLPILGKFSDLNLSAGTGVGGVNGWNGYGEQHYWASSLHEGTRFKGTPMLLHIQEMHAVIWLGRWFSNASFGSYFNLGSSRSNLMGMKMAVECYSNMRNRALADAIAARCATRSVVANGAFEDMLEPPSTNAIWEVVNTPTSSIPHVPGYSGFINPAAAYYFDLHMRVIPGTSSGGLRPIVDAAMNMMIDRIYKLLLRDGVTPSTNWQAFERQNFDGTVFSADPSADYTFSWPILVMDLGKRYGVPKAITVWNQLMERAPGGADSGLRQWFAPQPENIALENVTGASPGTAAGSTGIVVVGTGTAGTNPGTTTRPETPVIVGPGRGKRAGRSAVRQWLRLLGIKGLDP